MVCGLVSEGLVGLFNSCCIVVVGWCVVVGLLFGCLVVGGVLF